VIRAGLAHIREPLFLHAYALAISGLMTSGVGVIYWALAAHLYSDDILGVNAALLSLVVLLGNIAQLNLRSGFGRYVPMAGQHLRRLLGLGYLASTITALIGSLVVVQLIDWFPATVGHVRVTPLLAGLFVATTVTWSLLAVQEHALAALRRTVWVPIWNAIFAALKLLLLVLLAGSFGAFDILASWALPAAAVIAVGTPTVMRWASPGSRSAGTDAHGHDASGLADPGPPDASLRSITSSLGLDYIASLLTISATSLLPLVALWLLGPESSAHVFIVLLVAAGAQLLPLVLSQSLLVEASAGKATFERDARRVIRQLLLLLTPVVGVLVLAAPLILAIFGPGYAAEGTSALRLFALAALPYAVVQLAFVRLRLERRAGVILVCQAVLAIGTIVGSAVLLPRVGLVATGAAALGVETLVAAVLLRTELWAALIEPVQPRGRSCVGRARASDLP
jgi:O-antigen/teichoic acid export membrane protein